MRISYVEENTRRLEVESMVQFEARMENEQKEEGKPKASSSAACNVRDCRPLDETGEYFLLLLLGVILLYLVNHLLHNFFSPPVSPCVVDSSPEAETLVPALCQLEG